MRIPLIAAFASACMALPMMNAQTVGRPAVCKLEASSILGHSTDGIPQVSNLGDIDIQCSIPSRPFPSKPGESRNGLGARAIVHAVTKSAGEQAFAAEVNPSGGGFGDGRDFVNFGLLIPLKPADLDAEAKRYFSKAMNMLKAVAPSPEIATVEAQQRALENIRELIHQNRTGHYLVECYVMDGEDVIGVGTVDIEVLFKGRFSDHALPGAPPA